MDITTKNRTGIFTASALMLGSLVGTVGCDNRESPAAPTTTQKSTSPQQGAVSVEAALASIALEVKADYAYQNARGAYSGREAEVKLLEYRARLAKCLPLGQGPAEGSDFSSAQVRDELVKAFLQKGYLVSSGLIGAGFVSVEIQKLSGADASYQLPKFKVGPYELSQSPDLRIFSVEASLVDGYENVTGNKITGFRSLLPGRFVPEANVIVISPADIAEYAVQSDSDPSLARESVQLNEAAHAALQYFMRDVPNFEQLPLLRDVGNGKSARLEVPQVGEAFSDYVSLRYGAELSGLLAERARQSFENYAYSDELLKKGLVNVLQANPPLVDVKAIDLTSFKSSLNGVAAYVKVHPESLPAVRSVLVHAYETPLAKIFAVMKAQAPKLSEGKVGPP